MSTGVGCVYIHIYIFVCMHTYNKTKVVNEKCSGDQKWRENSNIDWWGSGKAKITQGKMDPAWNRESWKTVFVW